MFLSLNLNIISRDYQKRYLRKLENIVSALIGVGIGIHAIKMR